MYFVVCVCVLRLSSSSIKAGILVGSRVGTILVGYFFLVGNKSYTPLRNTLKSAYLAS